MGWVKSAFGANIWQPILYVAIFATVWLIIGVLLFFRGNPVANRMRLYGTLGLGIGLVIYAVTVGVFFASEIINSEPLIFGLFLVLTLPVLASVLAYNFGLRRVFHLVENLSDRLEQANDGLLQLDDIQTKASIGFAIEEIYEAQHQTEDLIVQARGLISGGTRLVKKGIDFLSSADSDIRACQDRVSNLQSNVEDSLWSRVNSSLQVLYDDPTLSKEVRTEIIRTFVDADHHWVIDHYGKTKGASQ